MPVTVIPAAELLPLLRDILAILDQAAKLADGGYSSTHAATRLARSRLHDLIAVVSE